MPPSPQAKHDLTRNQSLVLSALKKTHEPMSAYTLLEKLQGQGIRAPLQVYRALEKLLATGLAHRLETLNAFVACRHEGCDAHQTVAFAICDKCRTVSEITDKLCANHLSRLAESSGFQLSRSTVELRGLCQNCSAT